MAKPPHLIAVFLTEEGAHELRPYQAIRRLFVSETVLLCKTAEESGGFFVLEVYEDAGSEVTAHSDTVELSVPYRYISCLLSDPPEPDLIGFRSGNAKGT